MPTGRQPLGREPRPQAEPPEYAAGYLEFRGRRFAVDRRVYLTDPELTYLVDAVVARARELAKRRRPRVVEIGVGCGSLAISLALELEGRVDIAGLDVDGDALVVAAENARSHGVALALYAGDLFDALPPGAGPPDLVFADPPWGDLTTLYDGGRPATHYAAMPPSSVFAPGGVVGLHERILRAVIDRGWHTEVWLNAGVLDDQQLAPLRRLAPALEVLRAAPNVRHVVLRT